MVFIYLSFRTLGLVPCLCDLFVTEYQKKVVEFENQGAHREEQFAQESYWKLEEDLLGFLKAIALYGANTSQGIALLDDILVVSIQNCRSCCSLIFGFHYLVL